MNPEEGLLRPQLLDRFALSVDITASLDPHQRQLVVERRLAFDRNAVQFLDDWARGQNLLREQIRAARKGLRSILCSSEILGQISATICERGVRSLRADLAAMRASAAYAALLGQQEVQPYHVETVLPLVLAHRVRDKGQSSSPPSPPKQPPMPPPAEGTAQEAMERIFTPKELITPAVTAAFESQSARGSSQSAAADNRGPVNGTRRTETPGELDLRATLNHAVLETGAVQPRLSDLHERVRKPKAGIRYLFVIDSSGSHAAQERMRLVKGAVAGLLNRSFKMNDEVAMIVFRGTAAQVVLEPTRILQEAMIVLEYLPTGGRTPMAHALDLARSFITPATLLILLTDGRANVPLRNGDPWQEALEVASQLHCPALVIDTEIAAQPLGQSRKLADALGARYVGLENLAESEEWGIALQQVPGIYH
jgi:magnesium chelatase subunit D